LIDGTSSSQIKSDALLHSEALALCSSRSSGLPLDDRFAFIRVALALAVQFNDAAAQGRALIAAAAAHMDALEHSVFARESVSGSDDVPYFCCLPGSATDAMACACATVALGCAALHNSLCDDFGVEDALVAQQRQADYGDAIVLASLAFKDAGAYVSARTCAARATDVCRELIKLQLKSRSIVSESRSPRDSSDPVHTYIMRNLKRVKFYSSCQLLHVTAASIYAHACLLQDCNLPADAVQQFECSALLFAFLDQPSLHATCLLRTSECEGVQHVAVAMARVLQAPATHAARAIVPRLSAILHD
jgi:hypothetical protein